MGEWQDISTAPAVGAKKLLVLTKRRNVVVANRIAGTDSVFIKGVGIERATHWMPLPPAPEAQENDDG